MTFGSAPVQPSAGHAGQRHGARPEPFVSPDEAAQFVAVKRRQLLALARGGIAGAYPVGTGSKRKMWRFRLSELAAAIAGGA